MDKDTNRVEEAGRLMIAGYLDRENKMIRWSVNRNLVGKISRLSPNKIQNVIFRICERLAVDLASLSFSNTVITDEQWIEVDPGEID